MQGPVGRASVPAAVGGTGFQPVHPHRRDAGATKNLSKQFFMGFAPPLNHEKFMPAFSFDLEL
jgi:hypothetical protein